MWRRSEAALDRATVDGIIRKLMAIDAKLNLVLERLEIDDEEEEDDS
ncbi:MAG TPA: hypothetical protein VNI55_05155 [Gaiellaceae bacterium]|nr:hypothetical protein [Gaiellaceae bacterium]